MTRTVIIGGHGKVALLAAPLLAEAGHDVVSIIRNPDHAEDVRAAGAETLVLDLSLIHISEPTRLIIRSRMPSSA